MNYDTQAPSRLLAPYVKQYWSLTNCQTHNSEYTQRIVPSGLTEITFYLSDVPQSLNHNAPIESNSVVSGQCCEFYDLLISSPLTIFSITLYPQGIAHFFDLPAHELLNRHVALRELAGSIASPLEDRLLAAKTFEARVQFAEAFLLGRLQAKEEPHDLNRINDSVLQISRLGGVVSIGALAARACLSRKQYERTFAARVGASPKQFLRVVRFQRAVYHMQCRHSKNLTDLAHACGYYDQAHMINEFKALTGLTPRQYFADCEPFSDYFST